MLRKTYLPGTYIKFMTQECSAHALNFLALGLNLLLLYSHNNTIPRPAAVAYGHNNAIPRPAAVQAAGKA